MSNKSEWKTGDYFCLLYILYRYNKISVRKPLFDISHVQLFCFPSNASYKQNGNLAEFSHIKPPV